MQNNCIKNLLNFKEVVIKNIKNLKDSVEVYAEFLISEQTCPCCSTKTSKIHDHYVQPIKDIPIHLKPTTILEKLDMNALLVVNLSTLLMKLLLDIIENLLD